MVDWFADKYVEKERLSGSGRRGDIGPNRLAHAKMGKYAELAWMAVTGGSPDFDIPAADASAPDIVDDPDCPLRPGWQGHKLHVKTCKMAAFDGPYESWTAAHWDRIVKAPSPSDIILLAFTDPDSGDTITLGWVYASEVQGHWQPCKLASMAHKRALYRDAIKHLIRDFSETPK
ncbi:hypothetical protein [Phenylobacterium sp. SCN 70-31]|uniref:hypothetical protein n=1 Tax=Phenylobacterium sp. SCN 70-31 TaxID=1660129 RepID=UPI0025F14F0A|nr:hypothetical protein [Phenylobacterium sp. SCN 70-31]